MRPGHASSLHFLLLVALATPASAQDISGSGAVPPVVAPRFDQIVYKGLVGNVLDAIPMDSSNRLDLQRANAVVSNTFFGRSLAVLAGLSNPVLLLGGFVWGVWSAANINPALASITIVADQGRSGGSGATQERVIAAHDVYSVDVASASGAPGHVQDVSGSAAVPEIAAATRPRIFKMWLPQQSPVRRGPY